MTTILILFGANTISYNVAAALHTNTKVITCLPNKFSKLLENSSKYDFAKVSKFSCDDERYVDDVIETVKNNSNTSRKTLTFLTNDQAIYFWIKNKNKLSQYCSLTIDNIENYYNKQKFYNQLEANAPETIRTWTKEQKPLVDFPIIAKPTYKDTDNKFYNKFSSKIIKINCENDLKLLNDFSDSELIFQEEIDFDSGKEFSWWGYRNKNGEIVSVTARHCNKFPDKSGRITKVKIEENFELKKLGNNIVDKLNYVGIADIQFIRERDSNQYKIIEMNPRLWCSHEVLLMNNINLIRLCVDEYYGTITPIQKKNYTKGISGNKNREWYSILYNIDHFSILNIKCSEFYELGIDNFFTKSKIFAFLIAKFFYYYIRFKLFNFNSD